MLPSYPADHKVGIRVPKGGSDCAKCEYVDGQDCTQEQFVKWNGSERIPASTDEYCCDFFEVEEKPKSTPQLHSLSSLVETSA